MRQVKGPPAPAPCKHSLYICWLRKRRHRRGRTFLLMTRAPAMVRALQLQEAGGAVQPQTRRTSGKVWDNTATWWLLRSITAGNNLPLSPTHPPASACAGLWGQEGALQEGQGMDAGTPVLLTQMGNRKIAALGREHEGISANGQGWSLRSTQGCRLPGCRDVDEPGMKGWKCEPLGERVSGVTVQGCL